MGPKMPKPAPFETAMPLSDCQRPSADLVSAPKYPVAETLKYPWCCKKLWSDETSLPRAPVERERRNTGQEGPMGEAMAAEPETETLVDTFPFAWRA